MSQCIPSTKRRTRKREIRANRFDSLKFMLLFAKSVCLDTFRSDKTWSRKIPIFPSRLNEESDTVSNFALHIFPICNTSSHKPFYTYGRITLEIDWSRQARLYRLVQCVFSSYAQDANLYLRRLNCDRPAGLTKFFPTHWRHFFFFCWYVFYHGCFLTLFLSTVLQYVPTFVW